MDLGNSSSVSGEWSHRCPGTTRHGIARPGKEGQIAGLFELRSVLVLPALNHLLGYSGLGIARLAFCFN